MMNPNSTPGGVKAVTINRGSYRQGVHKLTGVFVWHGILVSLCKSMEAWQCTSTSSW